MDNLKRDFNDEEYVNDIVDTFKKYESELNKNNIFELFMPYFNKYVALLTRHNVVGYQNKDTLTFLRLFMNDQERMNIHTVNNAAPKYIYMLRKIFSDYSPEDMYNQIVIFFLEVLYKYRPMIATNTKHKERISFTHYMQVNMRFKLKQLAKKKSKDALSGQAYIQFDDLHNVEQDEEKFRPDEDPIDLKWVYGDGKKGIFSVLTEAERYLVWLKYETGEKKKTDEQISKLTGLHYKTIVFRLKKIREKLNSII